jgi:PAS domain S-box-containing protein
MPDRSSQRHTPPRARNLELALTLLVLVAGLPAVGLAVAYLWRGALAEVRWLILVVVGGVWIVSAALARRLVVGSLNMVADLLGALREGNYSIRGLSPRGSSSMSNLMREVNDLGSTLQRQRIEAVESTQLLKHVMEEIDVSLFAFDPNNQLLFVNRAGERLLGAAESVVGSAASALGLEEYLSGEPRRLVDRAFSGPRGRYEIRRAVFYRQGRPHQLIVVADLSRALREEEQAAWQRIVRVLSHEINNSLTPIKSIAHSLRRIVDRANGFPRDDEVQQGLALIEARSGALGRFLREYAQLARLPKPNPAPTSVHALIGRVVELEKRMPIMIQSSPGVSVFADSDQVEQLLINLVRNAVDASLETGGKVSIAWKGVGDWVEFAIDDEGRGLPDKSNLFVPFFTTKPSGSGIGLALSRQIAEAHGGTITLENHATLPGCRATLRLPRGARAEGN